jgi:hypothetical protein
MRTSPFVFLRLPADSSEALAIVEMRTTKRSSRDMMTHPEINLKLIL